MAELICLTKSFEVYLTEQVMTDMVSPCKARTLGWSWSSEIY
ncbi:hypothetical protein [Candidatus Enterovibrio escicola]|uniref:Uncharacterized protein n=1 Tax=Candidatus Enterovibrio escicola TaxID=1927127 RepID=A0A2A5T5L3_9GAMM|nr:hypothetical protein [Candidatus Enterovibrio escacola]PCS23442.1 hypothetical protein BTN49_0410 [Candidatus Enterovibrio escacola]